jgi:hypothetical protein
VQNGQFKQVRFGLDLGMGCLLSFAALNTSKTAQNLIIHEVFSFPAQSLF